MDDGLDQAGATGLRDKVNNHYEVIFKGGTSLSKGWDLIQRFSRGTSTSFSTRLLSSRALTKRGIDRELKTARYSGWCPFIELHPHQMDVSSCWTGLHTHLRLPLSLTPSESRLTA
jgi:hypothetical protein